MNKYPAPAPQQYSDYEDDDGPGLGTLGAALAAGALLTPVGRPVRALAKKGLGAADSMLGGAGGRGVDRVKAAGIAAGKAMFPEGDTLSKLGKSFRDAEALKLAKARELNPDFDVNNFSDPAAYMHNLDMTVQGPKSVFETLFRSGAAGGPQLTPNAVAEAAVASAVADGLKKNAGQRVGQLDLDLDTSKAYANRPKMHVQMPTEPNPRTLLADQYPPEQLSLGGFRPVSDAERTEIAKMLAEAQPKADSEYARNFAARLDNKPSNLLLPGSTAEERAIALAAAEAVKARAAAAAANGRKPRTPRQKAKDSNK